MKFQHRVVCAVVICNNDLIWESDTDEKEASNQALKENGWSLNFGKWICSNHKVESIGTWDNPCCEKFDPVTGCEDHSPKETEKLGIFGTLEGLVP